MKTLSDRLKLAMKMTNPITRPIDLARACNIKSSSVADWLNGRTKHIEGANLLSAAELLKVNPRWLATGEGHIGIKKEENFNEEISHCEFNVIKIPLFKIDQESNIYILDQDEFIKEFMVTKEWINCYLTEASNKDNIKILIVKDKSMVNTFDDGDILFIDTGVTDVQVDGAVYAIIIAGMFMVRRLKLLKNGSLLEVSCDNPSIRSTDVYENKDDVKILGRILWAWNGKKI